MEWRTINSTVFQEAAPPVDEIGDYASSFDWSCTVRGGWPLADILTSEIWRAVPPRRMVALAEDATSVTIEETPHSRPDKSGEK
jgi:hypothetical protein